MHSLRETGPYYSILPIVGHMCVELGEIKGTILFQIVLFKCVLVILYCIVVVGIQLQFTLEMKFSYDSFNSGVPHFQPKL